MPDHHDPGNPGTARGDFRPTGAPPMHERQDR